MCVAAPASWVTCLVTALRLKLSSPILNAHRRPVGWGEGRAGTPQDFILSRVVGDMIVPIRRQGQLSTGEAVWLV